MEIVLSDYAPVLIPTLNRYDHFRRCVESLSKCTHAEKTELIIGLDYPPSEEYKDGWKLIEEYVNHITGFKKVTVISRTYNYGVVANYTDLIRIASCSYDRFIFSEDDNVFSPNFLDFINKGLEKYKDDPHVVSVCGYNYPIDMSGYDNPYYFSHEFSAWGFGRWINKMDETNKVIEKPGFLIDIIRNNSLKVFIQNKTRLCSVVRHIGFEMRGDAYMTYYQYLYDKYSLFPSTSLVRNYGHDGSGVHCGDNKLNDPFSSQIIDRRVVFDDSFDLPVVQEEVIKRKLQSYHASFSMITCIKRVLLIILVKLFAKLRG